MPKRASNKLKSINTKLINGKIKTDSYPLHVCTKFIADLYRRALRLLEKSSPRRAPVYKGFSKNVGLDEANQTKRIILPEPFVRFIRQRLFRKRKAPVDLSEPSNFTPKSSSFTPYSPPFQGEESSYLGWLWQRCKAPTITITLTLTSIR